MDGGSAASVTDEKRQIAKKIAGNRLKNLAVITLDDVATFVINIIVIQQNKGRDLLSVPIGTKAINRTVPALAVRLT